MNYYTARLNSSSELNDLVRIIINDLFYTDKASLDLFSGADQTGIATVERLDPKARWTDRVPLPILAVILVLAFGAVAMIANLANPVLMLFGRPITGAPATMTQFAFAGLSAVLAVQLYRLKESAWWTLILLQIAGVVVAVAIIATTDSATTPPDIAQIHRDPLFIAVFAATWIGYFAFLVYLRRFFVLVPAPRTRRDD